MKITARELNRATLARQLLLRRERLSVVEGVRRVVALQAQHAASPYVALWNRISGFDPGELDAAFMDRSVVKATLMRITLHAVHVDDAAVFQAAMRPTLRGSRLGDARFSATGLSIDDIDKALPELLAFAATPRSGAEIEAWLRARFGDLPKPGPWWAVRSIAPMWHVPGAKPWSFGTRPAFVAAGTYCDREPDEALRELVLRYLAGFGPASVADVAQFALVQRTRARDAVEALAGSLEQFEGPDGTALFDIPGGVRPSGDTPAPPRLMAMWDSTLLAYGDRGRVIPPEYRKVVIRQNGDVLPTLLVDGHVAGVWRALDDRVEVTAFHPLPQEAWDDLAQEAAALVTLLNGREPRVYSRYHHWWDKLQFPTDHTRLLPD